VGATARRGAYRFDIETPTRVGGKGSEMRPINRAHTVAAMLALAAVGAAVQPTSLGATNAAGAAGPNCPQNPQRLPANALAPASRAALHSQRSRYEDLGTRPLVTRAALAEFDGARGAGARRDCGRRVQRRTVVVYLESASRSFRRRHPSLSQGVVFVARLPIDRYRVWRVVH
jgi:hypothetical protein